MDPKSAWQRFEATGKIEDYLQYKQAEQRSWEGKAGLAGESSNADYNLWHGPAGENH